MDQMSLFSVLTVSIPEYILDIYVAFLITGEKTHLYLSDRINIVRLAITLLLMTICVWVIRTAMPNLYLIFICNFIVYTIILKFVYSFKWSKAFINVLFIYASLFFIESIYTPIFLQIFDSTIEKLLLNDINRLIYTIPERTVQIFLVVSLWNWNIVLMNLKEYKKIRVPFIIFMIINLSVEWMILFIFCLNYDKFNYISKIVHMMGFVFFAFANFSMFKFISVLTNSILENEWVKIINLKKRYINEKKQTIRYLESGDIVSAINILKDN